jgi:hypothetical protein
MQKYSYNISTKYGAQNLVVGNEMLPGNRVFLVLLVILPLFGFII